MLPHGRRSFPEVVPPSELSEAVALNGAGFNVARAVGPALGGIIVAAAGPGSVFLLNAASFVAVLLVIYSWQREPRASRLPAEHVIGAIRAGIRYVSHAPELQVVLVRTGVFILCGAALWALLPLVASQQLGLGATGYGVLLGCLGGGAILGAAILPQAKGRLSVDALVASAVLLFAVVTLSARLCVAMFTSQSAAMVAGGVAWIGAHVEFQRCSSKGCSRMGKSPRAGALFTSISGRHCCRKHSLGRGSRTDRNSSRSFDCGCWDWLPVLPWRPVIGWREAKR